MFFGMVIGSINVSASTLTGENNTTYYKDYKVEVMNKSNEYSKIKITNSKSGYIEYLDSYPKDEQYNYIATTKEGKYSSRVIMIKYP